MKVIRWCIEFSSGIFLCQKRHTDNTLICVNYLTGIHFRQNDKFHPFVTNQSGKKFFAPMPSGLTQFRGINEPESDCNLKLRLIAGVAGKFAGLNSG